MCDMRRKNGSLGCGNTISAMSCAPCKDAIVTAKYSDGGDYGAMGGWMCVFFFSLYFSRLIKRR